MWEAYQRSLVQITFVRISWFILSVASRPSVANVLWNLQTLCGNSADWAHTFCGWLCGHSRIPTMDSCVIQWSNVTCDVYHTACVYSVHLYCISYCYINTVRLAYMCHTGVPYVQYRCKCPLHVRMCICAFSACYSMKMCAISRSSSWLRT